MDKPELIIPVRFDYKNAAQDLKKFQQVGNTSAEGFHGNINAATSLRSELRNLIHQQEGLGAASQVPGAISDEFQETLDYIKGASKEFTELHRTLYQTAALPGQADPTEFALLKTQEATTSGLNPEAWRRPLPKMNRVASQECSTEETAQALAILSKVMLGKEESGVESTFQALTNVRLEGKGTELGNQEGMTPIQQIEAGSRTLRQRAANGEDLEQLMNENAPDFWQRRGLLGLINHGTGTGGLERLRGEALRNGPRLRGAVDPEVQEQHRRSVSKRLGRVVGGESRAGVYRGTTSSRGQSRACGGKTVDRAWQDSRDGGTHAECGPFPGTSCQLPGAVRDRRPARTKYDGQQRIRLTGNRGDDRSPPGIAGTDRPLKRENGPSGRGSLAGGTATQSAGPNVMRPPKDRLA